MSASPNMFEIAKDGQLDGLCAYLIVKQSRYSLRADFSIALGKVITRKKMPSGKGHDTPKYLSVQLFK